jgi:hypothetical protein
MEGPNPGRASDVRFVKFLSRIVFEDFDHQGRMVGEGLYERDYRCNKSGWNSRSHAIVLSFNSVASAIIAFNSWSDTAPAMS